MLLAGGSAIGIESPTTPAGEAASAVFALPYWERVRTEQNEFQSRFGLHAHGAQSSGAFMAAGTSGRLRMSDSGGAERYAGLTWTREDFLLSGDRIGVHAASEVQLAAMQMGLLLTREQAEVLALPGWRSRLQLMWRLGEPERRIQWQLVSRLDRRRDEASEMVRLQATRRF